MKTFSLIFLIILNLFNLRTEAQDWTASGLDNKSILCIAVNPVNKNIIFAGIQDEGIYSSNDGGNSWTLCWEKESVTALTIDRLNNDIIYAGKKNAVLISRNGGITFSPLIYFDNLTVNSVILDETPSKAIILGTSSGVYKSFDNGKSFQPAGLKDLEISSAAINNKGTKAVIWCATQGGGIFKSSNYGVTWSPLNEGLSELTIFSILCELKDPTKLYAGTLESGMYASAENPVNWKPINFDITSRQGYSIVQSWDSKENCTVVFAANFSGEVFKIKSPGTSWQKVGNTITGVSGLCIGVSNIIPSTLYLGTTKGLYKIEVQ